MAKLRDEQGRIKGLPDHWQQFGMCVLLFLAWPLVPLILEKVLTGSTQLTSLTLSTAMYAIGVGISSRNPIQFSMAIVQGGIFSVFFGFAAHANVHKAGDSSILEFTSNSSAIWWASVIGMILTFSMHACERYNRHVVERAPFLAIGRKGE